MHIYAIGDVHGCFDKLAALLQKLPIKERDTVVFLGDYIDRGSQNRQVVDYLIAMQARRDKGETVFLKGNHEVMFLEYLEGKGESLYFANGGNATIQEYSVDGILDVPEEHLRFFRNLRLYYQTENYFFAHAGVMPGVSLDCQTEQDLLWIRGEFLFSTVNFGKKIIFGHTPSKDYMPFIDVNKIGIDTGAAYGGFLTAIQLPEERIYQS